MPETSIDEYGDASSAKNEIRFTENRLVTAPTLDSAPTKEGRKHQFCLFISTPPDLGHHLRAFCLAKNIAHGSCVHGLNLAVNSPDIS